MRHKLILSTLIAALVACEGQLAPTSTSSTVSIAGGDPTANGLLNGAVFGAEYGAGWDTVTAPLSGVTVEVYQVAGVEVLMGRSFLDSVPFDTFPHDTIPSDTLPIDTLPADTIPIDTVIVDTIPSDTLPPALMFRGSAVTDDEGKFSVTGIPSGQYVILIKPAASSRWAESSGWTFTSDGNSTTAGTFHLWPKIGAGSD